MIVRRIRPETGLIGLTILVSGGRSVPYALVCRSWRLDLSWKHQICGQYSDTLLDSIKYCPLVCEGLGGTAFPASTEQ
jgi:hypothetical protein